MCTEQLPSGGYPIAVKYIISFHIYFQTIYLILSNLQLGEDTNVPTPTNGLSVELQISLGYQKKSRNKTVSFVQLITI